MNRHTGTAARARPPLWTGGALLATVLIAGCATWSDDGGYGEVARLARERSGAELSVQRSPQDADTAAARTAELLREPLDADRAAQVALLNNRGLQARLAQLGVAEADMVQASRPGGLTLSASRLAGGGVTEIERAISVDLLGLLALPAARQAGQARFEQAQWQAAADAVDAAAEARRAFYSAVAAAELLHYQHQVQDAADASDELAQRMLKAGNYSALAQMREQAFAADAAAELKRAGLQALVARERLARALGTDAFKLPERLPALPDAARNLPSPEGAALAGRLDVQMARRTADAQARALGITQPERWLETLSVGWRDKRTTGDARQQGGELSLQLPWPISTSPGQARAEASYRQAVHEAAALAHDAGSQARAAYATYRSAHELALHYRDVVVPLRQRIADETLLRYNGMLASVFDLLADAREQVGSVTAAIVAQRDFWLAEVDLSAAVGPPH